MDFEKGLAGLFEDALRESMLPVGKELERQLQALGSTLVDSIPSSLADVRIDLKALLLRAELEKAFRLSTFDPIAADLGRLLGAGCSLPARGWHRTRRAAWESDD